MHKRLHARAQVAPPMSAAEIAATVRKRADEYGSELSRLRVKDLRNLLASLELPTSGLRPDLATRLVEHEAASVRVKLEAEAKEQAEKVRLARRGSLRIDAAGDDVVAGAGAVIAVSPKALGRSSTLSTPHEYTPGGKHRINSRQLMQAGQRRRAVRSELQAVEKVVTIDKKLESDTALSAAQRERLAAKARKKDDLNATLLQSCGLAALTPLRRVGIKGHHFDEYCKESEADVYQLHAAGVNVAPDQRRGGGTSRRGSRRQSQRQRQRRRSTRGRRAGKVADAARNSLVAGNVQVNADTTTRSSGVTSVQKTYFYHSPKMCRVWGVAGERMRPHVPLLIPVPGRHRLEGDMSASFVCGVALQWLHQQRLLDVEKREQQYRAWYDATHVRRVRGTHDRQEMRAGGDGGRIVDAAELRARELFEADMKEREAVAAEPIGATRRAWAELVTVASLAPSVASAEVAATEAAQAADAKSRALFASANVKRVASEAAASAQAKLDEARAVVDAAAHARQTDECDANDAEDDLSLIHI